MSEWSAQPKEQDASAATDERIQHSHAAAEPGGRMVSTPRLTRAVDTEGTTHASSGMTTVLARPPLASVWPPGTDTPNAERETRNFERRGERRH